MHKFAVQARAYRAASRELGQGRHTEQRKRHCRGRIRGDGSSAVARYEGNWRELRAAWDPPELGQIMPQGVVEQRDAAS
jgi:hypothetical protein